MLKKAERYSTALKTYSYLTCSVCTLKTRVMGFCTGMLVYGKALSNKYQRTKVFLGLNCTVGHTGTGSWNRANAWGENHLWVRCRKVFNLSGLIEPRILVSGESPRL